MIAVALRLDGYRNIHAGLVRNIVFRKIKHASQRIYGNGGNHLTVRHNINDIALCTGNGGPANDAVTANIQAVGAGIDGGKQVKDVAIVIAGLLRLNVIVAVAIRTEAVLIEAAADCRNTDLELTGAVGVETEAGRTEGNVIRAADVEDVAKRVRQITGMDMQVMYIYSLNQIIQEA